MFSIRQVGGVSLFLFGATFLWLTPVYAASRIDTSGTVWAAAGVFAAVTVIGFTIATWGLFGRTICASHWRLNGGRNLTRRMQPVSPTIFVGQRGSR